MRVLFSSVRCVALAVALTCSFMVGCKPKSGSTAKSPSPAKVEMVPHESDLATLTLTPEAETRLGIHTVAALKKKVQQRRTFGGEVMIPSGRSIAISSPVNGIVQSVSGHSIPTPGTHVKAGDILLSIVPLLSPERDIPTPAEKVQMAGAKATLIAAQVTAQGDVQRSRADVAAARIALDRANQLFADRAGSKRAVDDAQALFNVAQAVLSAAEERHGQLTKLLGTLEGKPNTQETADVLTLRAPVEGILRSLNVSLGQQVVGGSSLFEVLDTSKVWIRVPVFVDLVDRISPKAEGRIVALDGKDSRRNVSPAEVHEHRAVPVEAPPTADANSSSADLYFEIANQPFQYRPNQRVGVELPMDDEMEATIVPAASVLYDIHGGTWVYCLKEAHRFQRQRVTVQWFEGPVAVLGKGPAPQTLVVAEGAAELFGTEFGPGK